MKKKKLILAALAASLFIPSIVTPVNAADEEMEEIQVEMKEEGSPRLTVEVATPEEFNQAIKNDQTITLTADITLEGCVTINGIKNITIDLNNHTLSGNGKGNKSRGTQIKDSDVVIKNGNLKSIHKNGVVILGHSNVEIINCQVTTNEQDTFVISTNASVDPSTKVLVKESTIGTAQDVNGRGFSAYFPEGVVEILDSTVNGHMSISGGDVTIKGGTFNATGFGGQTYIYNEQETIEHLEKNVIPTSQLNNGMISTGEPVFIIDRRSDSYNLKRVTIEGVAFNTKIDLSGVEEVVHAIKYVDLNSKSSAARSVSKPAQIILKNNTYNHLPKETGPNMFIRRPESIGTHPNEIQEYTSIFVTEKGDSVEAGANRTVVSQNSTVTIESGSVTLNDSDKSIVKKTKLSPAILADEAVFHKIAEILGNSFVANPQDNIKIVATPELSVKPLSSGTDEYKVEISGKAKISAYKVATSTVNNETGNLGNCIVSHEVPLKTFTTQVILSIGVPASKINNNINVYVDHIGDEHDNYVGSSHLVKVDNSNTVTIPVNHFSIFTVSQASYPEIRSYAEEEATTSNLITRNPNADGITEIQVDPSKEVTFSVPTGINVSLEGEKVTKESVNIMPDRTVTFKLNDLTKKTLKVTAKFEDSSKIGESVYIFKAKSSGGGGGGAATPPASGGGVTKGVDLLRLYNPNSGEHFYTSDMDEKNALVGHGWIYEGTGWTAPEGVTNTPVYRLYNPNAGDHHYTKSSNERDTLVRIGWKDEGIGWYSDDKEGTPLFRLYNPNEKVGNHHYTTSEGERDYLTSIGWKDEGIGWYGVK